MKKKERRKVETVHRKFKRNFKPKIREILFWMSFLEQTSCFTTNKYVPTMNFLVASHPAQAQLPGPAQVKVYKTACSDKMLQPNEFTYVHNDHEGQMFHQCLARDVNLRGIFLMFRGMVAITTVVVAIVKVFST
jgi:hypothetical protein